MTGKANGPPDDLVAVYVPSRIYTEVIRFIAAALGGSPAASVPPPPAVASTWTAQQVRQLRQILQNTTARTLMDLTCASPGKRIKFSDICGTKDKAQARADLAGFTRLIRKTFNHDNWPVTVVQSSDGVLQYYADADVANAWTDETP